MKKFNFIANPMFLMLIIASFVYVYFFYLADGPARRKEAAEAEQEIARQAQRPDPATAAATNPAAPVAGFVMKEENPFNLGNEPGQMNVQSGTQFFDQQNRQSRRSARNVQPARYNIGIPDQSVVPVAGGAMLKTWIEAHWIGLEAGPLTPAVAKANNIPSNVNGVLIDEVTLLSADAGLLAGDVLTAVNGINITDLKSFKDATRQVAQATQTNVTIYRRGSFRKIAINGPDEFGMAQVEGAPMILATDRAPHSYYGPCDKCHSIAPSTTNLNQMARDLGDVLSKTAPNIKKGTPPPHGNRGACSRCHVLL